MCGDNEIPLGQNGPPTAKLGNQILMQVASIEAQYPKYSDWYG